MSLHLPQMTHRPALAVLTAVTLLGLAGCKSDEQKLTGFLERGQAALDGEQYEEAVIEYRNVLQIDPNNAEAHYALAKSYTQLEKLKEAYWELHESVRLDPSNVDARLQFAQFSLIARDFEEVLTQAEAIIEAEPDRAAAYTLQGEAYGSLERYEEAEASFLMAVERSSEDDLPAHLMNLVQFYSLRGENDNAKPHLDRLVEIDPSFRTWAAMGRFLVRVKAPAADAEAAFLTSLELAKGRNRASGYRNLAGFYFNASRTDEAVAILEQGIDDVDKKGRLDLIYLLARFQRSVGNEEAADALVEKATEGAGDDPQPFLVLSSYRGRKGDIAGALEATDQALAIDPENEQAKLRKAELLVDTGYREKNSDQIDEGRGIVNSVLDAEPSNAEALFVRAKIEMAELDPEAAAATLRSSLDVRPDWAQARFVLGSALMLLGDQNGARAELARAVELDPGLLEARRALARIHARLGEHEYAIEQGRIYLRESPGDIATQIAVAQSLVALGKRDEAYEELEKIAPEDRDGDAWYAVGRLEMAKGNAEGAHKALLQANAERPDHPEILRSLYRVESSLGKAGPAAERVRKAVENNRDSAALSQLMGEVALANNDLEQAEASFKRAVELDPEDAGAYQRLAGFYRVTGRLDESISTYKQSLQENPNSARLHERLAILYEYKGDLDSAVGEYELAIGLDGNLGESKNNLAYLLAQRGGDLDRALDLAQEAKALLPDNPNTADTLGWVLFKRGIPSAAIGYLREAAEGFEDQPGPLAIVMHHLSLAYEANQQREEARKANSAAIRLIGSMGEDRPGGASGAEPAWAADARALSKRLGSS